LLFFNSFNLGLACKLGKHPFWTLFEENLEKLVLSKRVITEKDIYIYSVQNGCLPSLHARPKLKELKNKRMITYDGELALTYSSLFGNKKRITKSIMAK
ncbi:MAG: hypothetical protein AAFV95_12680, partial [Bacteroidota bacterium]